MLPGRNPSFAVVARLADMMRMIAAVDRARGMATDSGIPWTLPTDQQFFSDQIAAGVILMGHGTYVEIDTPLHDRTNYVATHAHSGLRPGFQPVDNVPEFLRAHAAETINNIGGADFFTTTLPLADELILTVIEADFACTKFFPRYEDEFELTTTSQPISENGSTFTFQTWVRRV